MNLEAKQAAMRKRQQLARQREEILLMRGNLSLYELFDLVAQPMRVLTSQEGNSTKLRAGHLRPAKKQE